MYWIYLILFLLVVLTPKLIHRGYGFLREEDIEALAIFSFGFFALMLYLVKEKALIRMVKERLHLQTRANIITQDLSSSYSYIGGINRKFDLIKNFIFHLPKDTAEALAKKKVETFRSVIASIKLFAKTDKMSLRFVNTHKKEFEKVLDNGHSQEFAVFEAGKLLSVKQNFWEEDGYAVARSPLQAGGIIAYVIFAKTSNWVEDVDIFQILASEALLLFSIDLHGAEKEKTEVVSPRK